MATTDDTNLPTPQSYEQILADMLSSYAAKIGINDFNVGSAVTSFFEVVALTTARASGDIFQILKDYSVDRAQGEALQLLATENGVPPITASPTTGNVTVTDTSFVKISTQIYAGTNPPNIGSTTINVSSASAFPASGAVYLGRGTPNIEGPIAYSTPPVQVGNYWQITLSAPTTKFHNIGETVILSQGGIRQVGLGTIVVAPAVGSNPDISFSVSTAAIILDGETTVSNVPVVALLPGASGNVVGGTISEFASPPFTGATVTNPVSFTTGQDTETDDELRVRIKLALASIGLGTTTAIQSAVIGATAPDQPATITSTDFVQASYGTILFISNGGLYEAISNGVGLELIVSNAIGGEQFFQLATGGTQAPVAKAFLQSTLGQPFDLTGGDSLAVDVGGQTYQHNFATSDFRTPGAATAYEVTASINADNLVGFEAVTAGDGTYVVIRDKTEGADSIQITTPITEGRNAAVQMGFPSSLIETLRLFKNNVPLSKDGNEATVLTQDQSLWSDTIANGDTLILSVDGTAPITFTILNTDFIETGLYTNVSSTNSLASWVEVFNNKLTGVTAEIVGTQISLSSNLGANNRAKVSIDPGSTLVTKAMFSSTLGLSSDGKSSDFTLDRNTAQFELVVPLVKGDILSAGSDQTEGNVQSEMIAGGAAMFTSQSYLWVLTDDAGTVIPTGVISGSLLSVSAPALNIVRYTSNSVSAFGNVLPGDYVIVWSTDIAAVNRFEGRVHAVTGTTLDILVTNSEYNAVVPVSNVTFNQGFVVVRCNNAPQKFEVTSLPVPSFPQTLTLDQIVSNLNAQTNSLTFSVQQEEYITVSTNTLDVSGSVMIVTADALAQFILLPTGVLGQSVQSLIAFYDSQEYDAELPLFIHSPINADVVAYPPDTYISAFQTVAALSSTYQNNMIKFLHPYGTILDAQPFGEYVQETSVVGSTIGITNEPMVRRLRAGIDRFFVASPLDFGPTDTIGVVVDNNPVSETFEIPLFRVATINSTVVSNTNTFNAYDTAAGPTASFATSFGSSFNFANYKVWMQAKKTLTTSSANTAVLYRSAQWGESGQYINVGYAYPSAPNQPISSIVTVTNQVNLLITLASGGTLGNGISSSTQWNITVASGVPSSGVDQVTYTWNGTGSNPNLILSGGEYVNILSTTGLYPGVFRVSTQAGYAPTSTSFTVPMPHGVASPASNVNTTINNGIIFYSASPTTANQVIAYANANLSQYLTATLANYLFANTGAGTIVYSTYEDTGFINSSVALLDGFNYIASSNLAGSPQFTLKNSLTLPTDVGYAFNNGEVVELTPTTMEQVNQFISTLAVTGYTTAGTVGVADRGTRLVLATETLGSAGSIQILGGTGNEYQTPILDAAQRVNNTLMSAFVNNIAGAGINSGQWFRLNATQTQKKEVLFNTNTSITITPSIPHAGQSTISLLNRQLNQRYFGKPRHHIRPQGDTFRIEQQGSLVCLSRDPSTGSSPNFQATLNFNDTGGGTVNITQVAGSADTYQYAITSGAANFTALSIGDLVTVAGVNFNAANTGTFLVSGVSDVAGGNGTIIQVLNPNGVAQSGVTFVAGNFSATSQVSEGDTMTITAPFNVLNQGRFRVIRRFNDSVWFENPNAVEEEVLLAANPISLGYDSTTEFTVVNTANTLYLSWNGTGTQPTLNAAQMGDLVTFATGFSGANQGTFMVLDSGTNFLEVINPSAVAQSAFSVSDGSLVDSRPQIQFSEYEATDIGDTMNFTSNAFLAANVGAFNIIQVVDRNTAVVVGTLTAVSNVSLNGIVSSAFVEETVPYYGYKRVLFSSALPGSTDTDLIIFDSNFQTDKINQSASVQMVALNKLNFSTTIGIGLDAYRYNTGLIREANRIIYGDPRDNITYPGVGAAGADIFVQEPKPLAVQVALDVRLQTGVPFSQVVQQIQNTVSYVINSNDIGESIAISEILSQVQAIPGIIAVSISFPDFSITNDLITLSPGQKAVIIDPAVDISVSLVGS